MSLSANTVAVIDDVDVTTLAAWIVAIPFEAWPQQHPVNGELRPAMVNDLAWHGFGARTDALVAEILGLPWWGPRAQAYQRMLSVVMPGQGIDPHPDAQAPGWLTRVHVPILSNDRAVFIIGGKRYAMQPGMAYAVNVVEVHEVRNEGVTPRVHFMFDVRST